MERRSKAPVLIPTEELITKFKSKLDLYTVMSVDMNYFLPPYDKCPVAFLRPILSGEKKVIKNHKAVKVCSPKYKELSTRRIWDYVKEEHELYAYFTDYTEKQCPDKDHLFSLLGALREVQLNQLIKEARKKRSIHEEPNINEYFEVDENILKELQGIFAQKTTRGKACFMLKKGANLKHSRRNPAQHLADLKMLNEKEDKNRFEQEYTRSVHKTGDKTMESQRDDEEEKE